MTRPGISPALRAVAMATSLLASLPALPQETLANRNAGGVRLELTFGFNAWPALADLRPVGGGEFDEIGYALGGAVHWPLGEGNYLLGLDAGLIYNESNIEFVVDSLNARGAYLVPSLKWRPGQSRQLSLDGGLGFYLVDIVELAGDYGWVVEKDIWQKSGFGGYLGGTWEFASSRAAINSGLVISFKTHFFDLGRVSEVNSWRPATLGAGAGRLSGPVYQLQLGYRWQ